MVCKLRAIKPLLSGLLLAVVAWQWGQAGWIFTKAQLAQYLIEDAWQTSLQSQQPQPPWPWADTWPVARLRLAQHNVDLYVLEGADGSALAFGPGHMQGTALPGQGSSVIGGHRDTHFAFLADIHPGDVIEVQTLQGQWKRYQITGNAIKNSRTEPLQIVTENDELVLVTCYPFNAIDPGGDLRFISRASIIPAS